PSLTLLILIRVRWLVSLLCLIIFVVSVTISGIQKLDIISDNFSHENHFTFLSLKRTCLNTPCHGNLTAFFTVVSHILSGFSPYLNTNEIRFIFSTFVFKGAINR